MSDKNTADLIVKYSENKVQECPNSFLARELIYVIKHPSLKAAYKKGWIKKLKESPEYFSLMPSYLHSDPDILKARKYGVIKKIINCHYFWLDNYRNLPMDLQIDPDVTKARIKGWAMFFKNNKNPDLRYLERSLTKTVKSKEILDALAELFKDTKKYPNCLTIIEKYLKTEDEERFFWIKNLELSCLYYEDLPDSLKEDQEIKELTKNGFIKEIKENPMHFTELPEFLQSDADIKLALKESIEEKLSPEYKKKMAAKYTIRVFKSKPRNKKTQ